MKMCLPVLTEHNKSGFDSYSRQEQCISHIPYYLSGVSHAHFSDNLSRNSCILYSGSYSLHINFYHYIFMHKIWFVKMVSTPGVHPIQLSIVAKLVFFLFIGWEPTTWPANNYLQIMVFSCSMSSTFVLLQIIFCSCVNETTLFPFLRLLLRENGRLLP